jgi:hypothetical protein
VAGGAWHAAWLVACGFWLLAFGFWLFCRLVIDWCLVLGAWCAHCGLRAAGARATHGIRHAALRRYAARSTWAVGVAASRSRSRSSRSLAPCAEAGEARRTSSQQSPLSTGRSCFPGLSVWYAGGSAGGSQLLASPTGSKWGGIMVLYATWQAPPRGHCFLQQPRN